jgi:hypothetical protein
MENPLNLAISVGPIVLGVGLLVAIVCAVVSLRVPSNSRGRPLMRFALAALAVGVAAFVAGAVIGIAAFCSAASPGNLCGLGGVFGVGPFLAGICIATYAFFWLRGYRHAG